MRQRGVAKGRCEGIGDCDEEEGKDDSAIGEDGRGGCARGSVETQVDIADGGCEEGLDCVKEDGEFEELRGGCWTVGCSCQAFLEECPC